MVTKQSLCQYFPEFSKETTDRVNLFAQTAALYINPSVYGNKANFAAHLRTAHLIAMANKRGISGVVTQVKVGPMSTNYAQPMAGEPTDLDETSYGKMLKGLKRTVLKTPLTP